MNRFASKAAASLTIGGLWLTSVLCVNAEEHPAPVAAALHAALVKNIGHAREWLDQKDYKSLAQSAAGLQLLAEMLQCRSSAADWQQATQRLVAAASDVLTAARQEEAITCRAALDALEKSSQATAALVPTGQPRTLEKPPAIRPLMLTMDAIQADGKIALMTGNAEAAKKQAYVLSELARLVSNSRSGPAWTKLGDDFTAATLAVATTTQTDPKAVRQLFRGIAERCEACHETRGR